MLTEGKLDNAGARSRHSPCKYVTRLAQEAQVSMSRWWTVTETSHLRLYKSRQVQATEDGDYLREKLALTDSKRCS